MKDHEEVYEEAITVAELRSRFGPLKWQDVLAEAERSGCMIRYQYKESPVGRFLMHVYLATPADELRAKVKETRK